MTFANPANRLPRTHSQNRLGLSGVRRFPSPLQSSPPNTQDGRTDSWVSPSTNVNIAHPRPTRFHPAQILSQFERMSDNWEMRSITGEFLAEIETTEPQNPTQSSHPYSLVAAETPPKDPPIVDHARATEGTGPKELENAHRRQREQQGWESPKNRDRQHNSPSVPALRNNADQRISPSYYGETASSYSQYSYYPSQAARRRTSPENRAIHTFASQSSLTQSVNPTHDRFPVQEEEEDEPTTASDEDHSYTPYSPTTGSLDDPRNTDHNQQYSLNGGNMGTFRARGWDSSSDSLRVLDRNFDQPGSTLPPPQDLRTNPPYEQRRPAQSKFGYYDLQHFLEDPASAYIHRYLSSPAPYAPIPPTSQSPPPSPLSSMFENRDVPPSSPIAPVGSPYSYPFPHIRKRPAHSDSPLDPNAIREQLARQWQIYAQDSGYMTDSTFSPSTTPIQNAYYPWAFPHTSRTLDSGGRLHTDAISMQSSPSHESVPLPARPVNRRQERERYSARNPRPDAPIPPTRPPTPHSQSLSPSNSGLDPNLIQEQLARQWQIYAQNNMTAPLQNAYNPWAFLHTGRTRLGPDAMDIQSSPSREPVPLPAVLRRRERGKDLVLDIPSLRPDAPTSPPPHSQSPSPSPPPFPHLLGMFENTDMPPSSLIAPVGSPNLQPTDIGDPSFHQTDSVDEDASDAHSQAPPNVSEGLTGGSYFDLPVTEAHEPDHGSRDPDMPFGSLGIHMPLEAASPGESSAPPIVSTPSTPSLVIKGPFHYTFSNCSHDHSTRHNNLDFSLDKTIDSGVYLSRISRPSESLLPSLSAIMETRETISCPSKSLNTSSEDLYQALQTAHNILWQLSEQLAKILHKDNLSALDEFLAELVEISRVQGIRILGAISNLYPAFLGDSEALRRVGHKAIGEAVVEYMAWQDSVTTLLMGVEVEERQLGMAMALRRPCEEQAPVSGDEKEGLLPSLSAILDNEEENLSPHTDSQSLRAANHTIWKLSMALVDVSSGKDPLSDLDKLSVKLAEAIKVEGSSILDSISVLYWALSSAKAPTHSRREFMIKMLEEYKAWQENVNALLEAIGEEGSRLATCDATPTQPTQAVSSPRNEEDRRKTALQVIQAANSSVQGLLGETAEVMEKDGSLGDLNTLLTRSADSVRAEGIRIMSSISDLYLASSGGNFRDVPYEALTEVIPKLMTWKDNVVTLFNELGTEGDRLNGLGKLDFNEQFQVLPIHAEDHAKTLHQNLPDSLDTATCMRGIQPFCKTDRQPAAFHD